jgi:hypothetical protein
MQRGINLGQGGRGGRPDGESDLSSRLVGPRRHVCRRRSEFVELLDPEAPLLVQSRAQVG